MFAGALKRVAPIILFAALSASALAADAIYTRGSVWYVTFVAAEPGKADAYIDTLRSYYTTVYEEAVREKVILSYKIFMGDVANPGDWDIMVMIEMPNWASRDAFDAKIGAIEAKILGSKETADQGKNKSVVDRASLRKVYGEKYMQEIHLAK